MTARTYCCCLCLGLALAGCTTRKYVPLFEKNVNLLTARHSAAESHRPMYWAWRELRADDPDLYATRAYLDYAWERDPGYYEPMWGWGIFRLVQGTRSKPSSFTAECLAESVAYLEKARGMESLPEAQHFNLDMDLVHSLNCLGACLAELGEGDQSREALAKAGRILAGVKPITEAEKARYYEMTTYNLFYRGEESAAFEAAGEARKHGARMPKEFVK